MVEIPTAEHFKLVDPEVFPKYGRNQSARYRLYRILASIFLLPQHDVVHFHTHSYQRVTDYRENHKCTRYPKLW